MDHMDRSTAEVFDDHLDCATRNDVEADLKANFAPDCVLLTSFGRFDGHDGVREAAALLARQVPEAEYRYIRRAVHGEIAFLEWTTTGRGSRVRDGAESFLIRNDHIEIMTIHYTVESDSDSDTSPPASAASV